MDDSLGLWNFVQALNADQERSCEEFMAKVMLIYERTNTFCRNLCLRLTSTFYCLIRSSALSIIIFAQNLTHDSAITICLPFAVRPFISVDVFLSDSLVLW